MTTRIGLISDLHAAPAPVHEALSIFRREGVDMILCAGDIAGYGDSLTSTVELLQESGCRSILGNHEVWCLEQQEKVDASALAYFATLPAVLELEIEGLRLYMVHASPPDSDMEGIRLLDERGQLIAEEKRRWQQQLQDFDYDVLVVGHTHQLFSEQIGKTLLVNPGSTCFNHSCAILSLPEMKVDVFALSGQQPIKAWNWGLNQVRRRPASGVAGSGLVISMNNRVEEVTMQASPAETGASCEIRTEADYSGITIVALSPEPPLQDYLQAMALANRTAEQQLGEHMLLSWYDRDRDFESPQHSSECHADSAIPGYVDYGIYHGAKLKVDIEEGRFVFFYLPIDF